MRAPRQLVRTERRHAKTDPEKLVLGAQPLVTPGLFLRTYFGQGVYSMLCTLAVREASGRHLPDIKWGRLVASERQPKQPSSCPDTPPTHAVPLLPVWPLTAGPRARLRRKLVTAVVTPVHRCDGCLSDRDKQAS